MTTTKPANPDMAEADPREQRVRKTLRLSGLVLWLFVFAGLFIVWQQRRNRRQEDARVLPQPAVLRDTPAENSRPSGNLVTGRSTTNRVASTGPQSNPRVVVPKPNPPRRGPIWNPDGIGDFSLIERSGRTVTKSDLLGHPWAVCFIFTRCAGPCPRISAQMYELQTSLKNKNVRLVTITVDPKYDSPKILRRYAKMFGADPARWLFLTGDQWEIYRLIHSDFKLPVKEIIGDDRQPGFQVIHSTYILHVDAFGRVRGKYNATVPSDMIALRRALDHDRSAADYKARRQPVAAPKPLPGSPRREHR